MVVVKIKQNNVYELTSRVEGTASLFLRWGRGVERDTHTHRQFHFPSAL